jgi:hypothetical protein
VPWALPRDPIFTTPPNGPALTHRLAYLDTSQILQEGFLAHALRQTRLRKKIYSAAVPLIRHFCTALLVFGRFIGAQLF